MKLSRFAATGAALLALVQSAVAEVLVVDAANGPSTDFTTLQPAIDAAQTGDVVLVRSGAYPPFTVVGKELAIAGEGATPPVIASFVDASGFHQSTVRDVPAGGRVSLRGLELSGALVPGLVLADNQGAIWIEECSIEGLDVTNTSASVSRCTLSSASVALILSNASVAVYDSSVQGPWLRGFGSTLLCSSTSISGTCDVTGNGRSLSFSSPVAIGDTIVETYHGAPGEIALLALSLESTPWTLAPQLGDALHLAPAAPFVVLPRGALPGSGTRSVVTPYVGLDTGDSLVLYGQGVFVDPAGPTLRVSGPSALILLAWNFDPQPGT